MLSYNTAPEMVRSHHTANHFLYNFTPPRQSRGPRRTDYGIYTQFNVEKIVYPYTDKLNVITWNHRGLIFSVRSLRCDVSSMQSRYVTIVVVHHDVLILKQFPHHWPFVREIRWPQVDSPVKEPLTWSFDIYFHVSLNKLLEEESGCRRLETIWR